MIVVWQNGILIFLMLLRKHVENDLLNAGKNNKTEYTKKNLQYENILSKNTNQFAA